MNPAVSVVVPCLNRAHYLIPTLESIFKQTYPHIECIVVDGGSTDGTIEILRGLERRIRWISEPDRGPADAVNKGWAMSSGQILAWLNADDLWEPDAASFVVTFFEEHPEVDLVYGDCGAIDSEGRLIGSAYSREWDLFYAIEHADHSIAQPAAFIRRPILEKVGWLDPQFVIADRDLWYRIGLEGTIRYVPRRLAHARRHPSFWHKQSEVVAADCVAITRKLFQNPGLPPELLRLRRRAISNAYFKGAFYAWIGRRLKWIPYFIFRALVADPSNVPRALQIIGRRITRGPDRTRR